MAYASSTLRTVYATEPSFVATPVSLNSFRIEPQYHKRSDCSLIPISTKLSFAILLLASLIHLLAFATPVWITSHEFRVGEFTDYTGTAGLWTECGRVGVDALCQTLITGSRASHHSSWSSEKEAAFIVAQVFESLALLTSFLALFTLIAYLLIPTCGRKRRYALLILCLVCFTVILIIVALSVYGAIVVDDSEDLAWAFGLCCCCAFLFLIACIVFIPELVKPYEYDDAERRDFRILDASMDTRTADQSGFERRSSP